MAEKTATAKIKRFTVKNGTLHDAGVPMSKGEVDHFIRRQRLAIETNKKDKMSGHDIANKFLDEEVSEVEKLYPTLK